MRQELEARSITTVAILPKTDASGEKSYRAMSDDKPLCVYAGDKHYFEQLAREAHQIKGASANVGATAMKLAAEKLDKLAHNQEYE